MTNSIKCSDCGEKFEFEDDGTTVSMPDGYIRGDDWYCDDCGQSLKDK